MTPGWGPVIISGMASPGRRVGTPAEFKLVMAYRIAKARTSAGFTQPAIAKQLSEVIGRLIPADSYRKWETIESTIPHDAILPFCDLTKTHPFKLLGVASMDEISEATAAALLDRKKKQRAQKVRKAA